MLDLVMEGHIPPTVDQVAQRAGISLASVYRYFDTLADLQTEMAARFFELNSELFSLPDEGQGALEERVERLVDARIRLFNTIAPISRLGRSRAFDNPGLDEVLQHSRRSMAQQVSRHFETEISRCPADQGQDLAALLSGLVSIESWEHQHELLGRDQAAIARSWKLGILLILRNDQPHKDPQ